MEQFNLQHQIKIFDNGQAEVRLFPTNVALIDKIETFRLYENQSEAELNIDDFIQEMLPLLYNALDEQTKEKYYL